MTKNDTEPKVGWTGQAKGIQLVQTSLKLKSWGPGLVAPSSEDAFQQDGQLAGRAFEEDVIQPWSQKHDIFFLREKKLFL